MQLNSFDLLSRLAQLHSGYRVTLNLTNLTVEEVLELIYDCQGMITRLEIFNLKDYAAGKTAHVADISRLMQAINEGSAIHLKQVIRDIIDRLNHVKSDDQAQIDKLTAILHDIDTLKSFYGGRSLKARLGSDSTGRSARVHGMGLAIRETLPKRAQRAIERDRRQDVREIIPIRMIAQKTLTFIPRWRTMPTRQIIYWLTAMLPTNGWLGFTCREGWQVEPSATRMANPGNIVTLGGVQKDMDNELFLEPPAAAKRLRFRWRYLNSHLQNALKVIIGFIPAFLTFALTKALGRAAVPDARDQFVDRHDFAGPAAQVHEDVHRERLELDRKTLAGNPVRRAGYSPLANGEIGCQPGADGCGRRSQGPFPLDARLLVTKNQTKRRQESRLHKDPAARPV